MQINENHMIDANILLAKLNEKNSMFTQDEFDEGYKTALHDVITDINAMVNNKK